MSKLMLIIQDGYGTPRNVATGQRAVKLDVELGKNQHVRQVVVYDHDPEDDGSVMLGEIHLPVIPLEYVNQLMGKILTVTDAATADPAQRKAVKELIGQAVYGWHQGHVESAFQEARAALK